MKTQMPVENVLLSLSECEAEQLHETLVSLNSIEFDEDMFHYILGLITNDIKERAEDELTRDCIGHCANSLTAFSRLAMLVTGWNSKRGIVTKIGEQYRQQTEHLRKVS